MLVFSANIEDTSIVILPSSLIFETSLIADDTIMVASLCLPVSLLLWVIICRLVGGQDIKQKLLLTFKYLAYVSVLLDSISMFFWSSC